MKLINKKQNGPEQSKNENSSSLPSATQYKKTYNKYYQLVSLFNKNKSSVNGYQQ